MAVTESRPDVSSKFASSLINFIYCEMLPQRKAIASYYSKITFQFYQLPEPIETRALLFHLFNLTLFRLAQFYYPHDC